MLTILVSCGNTQFHTVTQLHDYIQMAGSTISVLHSDMYL